METNWKTLQADADVLARNMFLKGRIATGLEALHETLPKYTQNDFVVCQRKTSMGVWMCELYTKRSFEPWEILLAPHSSQIKDTHLMASGHAVVSLPKCGRGAHPENLSLALDGRGRTMIASAGAVDPAEHTGSLFWLVMRTTNQEQANLELENMAWQQQITVNLPVPVSKRRKVEPIAWAPSELPSLPILVNKKAIEKHVRLAMFMPEKKKQVPGKKPDA